MEFMCHGVSFTSSSTASLTTGHALDRGSISSKCPAPATSINFELSPLFFAAATYRRLISNRTTSSLLPAAPLRDIKRYQFYRRRGPIAVRPILRRSALEIRHHRVAQFNSHARRNSATGRAPPGPSAQSRSVSPARDQVPSAECPIATTRFRSSDRSAAIFSGWPRPFHVVERPRHPPPGLPMRRYSRLHVASPYRLPLRRCPTSVKS